MKAKANKIFHHNHRRVSVGDILELSGEDFERLKASGVVREYKEKRVTKEEKL